MAQCLGGSGLFITELFPLITFSRKENDKLRTDIRDHIRSSLCQTDVLMQLTKRLAETEKNLQRARSEVIRIKLKYEEMLTNNENLAEGVSPIYTVPPTRVVENLKHLMEKKTETNDKPEKHLKERVILQEAKRGRNLINSSSVVEGVLSEEKVEPFANLSVLDVLECIWF